MSDLRKGRGYQHWRCLTCRAYGHSNDREAEKVLVDRHRRRGHTVQVWVRGHKDHARILGPVVEPTTDQTPDTLRMGTSE